MKTSFFWKLTRLTAICAALFLSVYVFYFSKSSPKRPVLLTEKENELISPQTYKYVLDQPHVCNNRSDILVVFLVPVVPHHYAQREAVRQTWGAPGLDTLTLFFLGLPEEGPQKSQIQDEIEKESRTHGDIIQINFIDTYQNLTIKTLQIMRWLHARCPQAHYGMKVDADIFVNVFYLKDYLKTCPIRDFITGSVINDGRPKRDSRNKWSLSTELYPDDSFPPYVSGAGYVFSWDVAGRVSWASRLVRLIPLEDVYVGLCLRLLEIQPRYAFSLLPWPTNLFEVRNLKYERCRFTKVIIVNGFNPSQLRDAWEDFREGHAKC